MQDTAHRKLESLEDCLVGIAAGNAGSLRALYDQIGLHLIAVAARIVKRRDKAEDVVQDAFVSIWRRAADWSPERGSARTWIVSIVHHRAIDVARRDARLMPADDDALAAIPDPAEDPFASAVLGEDARRLQQCLGQLDANAQTAIRLAYWEGLTHEALAARLETPVGTVKSWIRRGLQRLKTCLDS
jgi:RNA polymerase sigma-70 factor (ECF subfamily)